jgi:5-methylthioribose kinase
MVPVELSLNSAEAYLSTRNIQARNFQELGGGVSNLVLLAETPLGPIVVKQSLSKLRVEQDWFSDRERIHRECEAMRMLAPHLEPSDIPAIVFEDRENCIFGMTAAPLPARPWKSILMESREARPATVEGAAKLLARIIALSRGSATFQNKFGDLRVFDQLRLDPYYRATAARHADLRNFFDELIAETAARRYSLVHGDWSPKNLLVSADAVTAIDFEVVHYGDPAFDIAFLINHLLLKSLYLDSPGCKAAAQEFFNILARQLDEPWLEAATIRHLGALMLARVDGKSPAEYIHGSPLEPRVRDIARDLILDPPQSIAATMERV